MVVSVFDARFSNRFTILLKISRKSVTHAKKTNDINKSRQLLFCSNNLFVYSIILKIANYELRIKKCVLMFNESGLKIFNQSPLVGNLAVFLLIGGDLLIYFNIFPSLHQHIYSINPSKNGTTSDCQGKRNSAASEKSPTLMEIPPSGSARNISSSVVSSPIANTKS